MAAILDHGLDGQQELVSKGEFDASEGDCP